MVAERHNETNVVVGSAYTGLDRCDLHFNYGRICLHFHNRSGVFRMTHNEYQQWLKTRSKSTQSRNLPDYSKLGAHSILQEFQTSDPGKTDNRSQKAKGNGVNHPSYRITVEFLYSDKRRRDLDGGLSTILDCLVKAVRRLQRLDTRDKDHLKARPEGQ